MYREPTAQTMPSGPAASMAADTPALMLSQTVTGFPKVRSSSASSSAGRALSLLGVTQTNSSASGARISERLL